MDALSEALAAVQVVCAIFYDVECFSPWGFRVPSVLGLGPAFGPGVDRIVNYHFVVEGEGTVHLDDGTSWDVVAGDIVVIPHGDQHVVSHGAPAEIADAMAPLQEVLSGRPSSTCFGADGAATRIVCGFFGCSRLAERLFLSGLPAVFKVHLRGDEAGRWLEQTVRHLVAEAQSNRPGSTLVLSRMAEVLFIETLRRHMHDMPPEQRGWLAAARDPITGSALALMHREPAREWSLASLASEVGASRSVLGERFSKYVGQSPLAYLGHWRLQLASRALEVTDKTVNEIAGEVGYQSESAFNRAFKRHFGSPPAQYRRRRRDAMAR